MNILYIAHRIPYPPDKGDKIRTYNTIRYLAKQHRVWCACFVDDPGDLCHVSTLREMCEDVVALPLRRLRASVGALLNLAIDESASDGFYRDPAMIQAITRLSRDVQFDAVIAFSSTMAQYAEYANADRKLVDLCDLDSRKWAEYAKRTSGPRSWLYRTEANRLTQRERDIVHQFDATILISRHEATDFGSGDDRIAVVGNGVSIPPRDVLGGYASSAVGFVGDMGYWPNEDAVCWFADSVWPQIISKSPHAAFRIIGRNPSPRVKKLTQRPGIEVTGAVDSVIDELAGLRCVVAPLRIARGVQNKVLEAMAAARPVIATTNAATGINVEHGRHLLIGDAPDAIVNHVIEMLHNEDRARSIGNSARQLIEQSYQWDARLEALEPLLIGV